MKKFEFTIQTADTTARMTLRESNLIFRAKPQLPNIRAQAFDAMNYLMVGEDADAESKRK
jgi:hypothetical protein